MRHLFTLSLLFLLRLTAYSQCCPYVQPVQVLPANPQPNDIIRLVFRAATPGGGHKISSDFVRVADTLRFTACYFSGMTAVVQSYSDTVTAGALPIGNYTIQFEARVSYRDAQQCSNDQRNSVSTVMQVATRPLATRPSTTNWTVYPVPATGRQLQLQSPAQEPLQSIRLLDISGRECYAHPTADLAQASSLLQLQLPALPAGTYTLRVQLANGTVKSQRVVLQ